MKCSKCGEEYEPWISLKPENTKTTKVMTFLCHQYKKTFLNWCAPCALINVYLYGVAGLNEEGKYEPNKRAIR